MVNYTRKNVDQSFERRFIIGLIVSDRFLREAQVLYHSELIHSQPVVMVAEWCFQYYKEYERAPQQHIQDIFDSQESKLDPTLTEFIEELLQQLSDEWEHSEKFNVDFLLDETEKYFKSKSLLNLSSRIREAVSSDNLLEAEELQAKYSIVQRQKGRGVDPFTDEEVIQNALSEVDEEPLFRLPGAIGEILNTQITRSSFIAMVGPEKRGKSFWLDELAIKAYHCRCNVALFELGDLTEPQRVARLHSHLSMKPLKRYHRSGKPIRVPVLDCIFNQDNTCEEENRVSEVGALDSKTGELITVEEGLSIGYKPCSRCSRMKGTYWYELRDIEPLSIGEAVKMGRTFFERSRGRRFKLSCHENSTLNVKGIHSILEVWKHNEGFVPDVIVIDYTGIMAPEDSRKEHRHQVNDTWKALRGLSQHWHACVITADQTDAESYEKENITLKNFSEDKRKYGHVTAMYSLNQTDEERSKGIMRIGELVIRQGKTDRLRKVHVLECREIGRVNLGSWW